MEHAQDSMAYILLSSKCGKEVEVRTQLEKLAQEFSKNNDVTIKEMYATLGPYDFILKLEGIDFYNIGQFVVEKVRTIPGVADTETHTGINSFKVMK